MEILSIAPKPPLGKWYVVQTKPRQEFRAKEHLENQGYDVFLPTCIVQKISRSQIVQQVETLFSRYLFINLDDVLSNWSPIRSTRGVHQLLRFGKESMPVSVPDSLIEQLHQSPIVLKRVPFNQNDQVTIQEGPFQGLQGIFKRLIETDSGEVRTMIFLEFLGKSQQLLLTPNQLRPSN